MNNRALISFGTGQFADLLEIAVPGMHDYACLHGYDLITRPPSMLLRPPSWHKITALLDALEDYEEALWIDCDVVLVDTSWDLADEIPPEAWQGITRHQTGEGEIPSCGVWYLRQPMQPVLEAIWRLSKFTDHRWWEQAALQQLLGYTPEHLPVHQEKETELSRHTHWLDVEWNALYLPGQEPDPLPRFAHVAPGYPPHIRAALMRELVNRTAPVKGA